MQLSSLLTELLEICIADGFSDVHLTTGIQPLGRLHGKLQPLSDKLWGQHDLDNIVTDCLTEDEISEMKVRFSVDSSASLRRHRFRFNIYKERNGYAVAIRRLESLNRTIDELGLPEHVYELTKFHSGLILFTGPTGSGKSTSMAALIDEINRMKAYHIITVEDPIEYLHENKKSLIHQRELGVDVVDFSSSLREALREDPDVILVGEMRDLATMRAAVTAAETGHLVISTLHCADTVGALDRILGMYPADEQDSLRRQLSMVLKAVVTQTLLPTLDEDGRCVIIEMLVNSAPVRNLIRNGQFRQIYSLLEIGSEPGMISMDSHLAGRVHARKISLEVALPYVRNPQLFRDKMKYLAGK
ncbi:type IV pilus twitching motility protein PilT [Rubritalea profundi]|uniref:Bacterial type II secretion system protein E domain-containing protein n=1 Tax=Rubritalea profundi TaxID=1658618 RepID=A0A2S7U689_9BACT|nr:PilT/PilU family type 4a pilus ATPase [Rubritalea profundi]PQJ30027.1 hypothetical protein BSZ32_17100 [Rubritalea profundi]